jgi:S1-C subfamily serine protease
MTAELVPGQNRPLAGTRVEIDASCLPQGFALAAVPLGPAPDAPFLGALQERAAYLDAAAPNRYAIDLSKVAAGTERIELVAYSVRGGRALREAGEPAFTVDGATIRLAPEGLRFAAAIFARLYRHSGAWKLRALAEGSGHGLSDLGRLLGRELDQSGPAAPPQGLPLPGRGGSPAPDWTGSGFLVAPGLILSNAHVVKRAREIVVSGFDGRCVGETVLVDENCDLALVRVERTFGGRPLPVRSGHGPSLGETAIAVGYPLAGFLGSGPQVTDGRVSGLLGPEEDTRIIQVTTPVQGGSSGGPLFDAKGRVIGVVTAMLMGAQSVNFAVRGTLAQAIVEAAGKSVELGADGPDLDIAAVARATRESVWRLEARQ